MKYTSGRFGSPSRKDWGGTLTGASTGIKMGASIGMMFGPVGGAIGTGIGAIAGGLFGNSAENKRDRETKKQDAIIAKLKEDEKLRTDLLNKKQVKSSDMLELNNMELNNTGSLFMKKGGGIHINPANKGKFNALKHKTGKSTEELTHSKNPLTRKRAIFAQNARKWKHTLGGEVNANGMSLGEGNKLLTKNGSINGTHESGANIPIKKNGKTLAIAEPGEVLVNDKDISNTPFVLSKRLGFAQKFMELERMKNTHNSNIIEDEQSKLVNMNNRLTTKGRMANNGLPITKVDMSTIKMPTLYKNNVGLQKSTLLTKKTTTDNSNMFSGLDMNTIADVAGTVGNLIMSNKTLKRQKGLVQNSLNDALNYTPKLNKNYLLNDNVDINDQVSGIDNSYNTSIAGLEGLDPAIVSALKNSAGMSRNKSLGSVFANRTNIQTGIRNQNTMNIMNNNNSNTSLLNQTLLMKLNAKIAANESLGEAENARLANVQGAVSEFNTIRRDKQMMDSLDARWKDSIGKDYTGKENTSIEELLKLFKSKNSTSTLKYGGKIRRRKHTMSC